MSVIRCLFSHLVERAEERGYTIHHVMPCIVHIDGDYVSVDTEHMAYPAPNKTPEEIEAQAQKINEYYASLNSQFGDRMREHFEQQQIGVKPRGPQPAGAPDLPIGRGPGTELKKLLAKIGIHSTATCSCNARAQLMDEKGAAWCRENETAIIGWLREEATKRALPFVDLAGKLLLRRAIALAEAAEKKRKQQEAQDAKASNG